MNKLIAGGVATVAVLGVSGASFAATVHHPSLQAGGSAAAVDAAHAGRVVVRSCDSGPVQRVYNRIVNTPSISGEGVDTAVPGAGLVVYGKGTVNVTFSAEDQLRGSTVGENYDWAELEVRLDGVPMQPAGPASDPMAITGAPTYAMNSAQFCAKIGPGRHRIQAFTRITDNGVDDNLSLWLDDYDLRVEQS
jgi:hypothetical protein